MKAKIITKEEYHHRAQHGARILLEIEEGIVHYRVLDGLLNEDESYFIVDFMNEPATFYLINLKDCYDICACELAGVEDEYVIEIIEEILNKVETENAEY